MRKFGTAPIIKETVEATILKKEIFWGCESGDRKKFPSDMETISYRLHSQNPRPMNAFRDAFMQAEERVLIVDPYFLAPEHDSPPDNRITIILDWLHDRFSAPDVRILTARQDGLDEALIDLFKERENELNALNPRRQKLCRIQINRDLKLYKKFLHDRFAIIDNELWHFGATVGGFHSEVNAASRGWCAIESGAIQFFEMAWMKCQNK